MKKFENHKKDKKKKKKRNKADELFEELGYKKIDENERNVRYTGTCVRVTIEKSESSVEPDYMVLATTSNGRGAQWLDKKTIKAIRRKAKEKGWL